MKKIKIALGVFLAVLIFFIFNSGVRSFFTDSFIFFKAFLVSPSSVGAVTPNSSFLAIAMTKYIKRGKHPIRVLEVGAGTGSTTDKILKKLRKGDVLDVVELDSNFCELLNKKFEKMENVRVSCLSILDWNPGYQYDFIISGLPFNDFDSDFIELILKRYKELTKPGGIISYFEYIALAKIKLFFLRGNKKTQFSKTITTTTKFRNEFEFDEEKVFANIPPASVYHLRVE